MSDYRDLRVYSLCRKNNQMSFRLIQDNQLGKVLNDQLSRACISVSLNLAEGAGRFSPKDQRKFYITSRASALECMAVMDAIEDLSLADIPTVEEIRSGFESASKMIFKMIRRCEERIEKGE